MRTSPRSFIVTLALALALLATACGSASSTSDSSTESASAAQTEDSSESPSSDSSSSESSSDDEPEESPIGDLLGEVFGIPISDSGAMDEYFADLGRQAEVKVAECMLAEGFEYTVVDYDDLGGISIDEGDDREFAEQYGFGITSNPFEESFEAFEQFEDPNQDYVASLSVGERDAYYAALYGNEAFGDSDSESGSADIDFSEPSGCQGDAFQEVFSFAEVFDQFNDEFDAIEEAYEADPRVVAATSGWSECMTAAGYRYTDEEGATSDINRRYRAIVSNPDAAQNPEDTAGSVSSIETSGVGDDEDFVFFGPATLKPEYQAQVDALADEERAIATASWDCNEPLREVERTVRVEYEQKFVDENGAAIRAALDE